MELRGVNIVLPDRRGEPLTVNRFRGVDRPVLDFGLKTVHELDVARVHAQILRQPAK